MFVTVISFIFRLMRNSFWHAAFSVLLFGPSKLSFAGNKLSFGGGKLLFGGSKRNAAAF